MKTYEIKNLMNTEVLIIELPEGSYLEITSRLLAINHSDGSIKIFKGFYTLLGKPDDIRGEDAKEIVGELYCDNHWCEDGKIHQDYGVYVNCEVCEDIHVKELLSAIETVVLWENPYAEPDKFIDGFDNPCYEWWQDAELRTFDRNRSIILVKN